MDNSKYWIFTFGAGQEHEGQYVLVKGTAEIAREKMCERYDNRWAFQYSIQEWEAMVNNLNRRYPLETLYEIIV